MGAANLPPQERRPDEISRRLAVERYLHLPLRISMDASEQQLSANSGPAVYLPYPSLRLYWRCQRRYVQHHLFDQEWRLPRRRNELLQSHTRSSGCWPELVPWPALPVHRYDVRKEHATAG